MQKNKIVKPIEVKRGKPFVKLIDDLGETGFQAKTLSRACHIFQDMVKDPNTCIIIGYAGSLSTTGQWKIIKWLIENEMIDILVPTGANISEDIVEALGYNYYQGSANVDDRKLFRKGFNRYYDIYGKEEDYFKMTELISNFILTLDSKHAYSSREFLNEFGLWLDKKNIKSIVASAAKKNIPVFCPAIVDSPYGDAILLAKNKNFSLIIDSAKDYVEFMNLSTKVKDTGVLYFGGGVPKDFIQLFAVSPSLLFPNFLVPNRNSGKRRAGTDEYNYPHKYAIQITSDSPQWGGLSGCTFEEAISWGKETLNKNTVQCYCDVTIALPILSQYLSDSTENFYRVGKNLNKNF